MENQVKSFNPVNQNTLSARLKKLLQERDISVSTFAKELGVSRQTAHKWLKDNYIHPKSLAKIAKHLDTSYSWLSLGAESGENPPEYNPCKECDLKEKMITEYRESHQSLLDLNFHLQTVTLISEEQFANSAQIQTEPLKRFINRVSQDCRDQFHTFYQGLKNKRHESLVVSLQLNNHDVPEDYLLTTISICGHHCALISIRPKPTDT